MAIQLLLLLALGAGSCRECATLHVTVTGFRNNSGEARVALYATEDGFPMEPAKAERKAKARIVDGRARFDFTDIAPGEYALSALHDENDNGKLDRNFVGIPKEGYGASNNPIMPKFGPPTFASAAFKAKTGEMTLEIALHYYLR